jgi:hypothetical protein
MPPTEMVDFSSFPVLIAEFSSRGLRLPGALPRTLLAIAGAPPYVSAADGCESGFAAFGHPAAAQTPVPQRSRPAARPGHFV